MKVSIIQLCIIISTLFSTAVYAVDETSTAYGVGYFLGRGVLILLIVLLVKKLFFSKK